MLLFFSLFFFRLFISCAQAYISLFAPSSQILPASRQARQICHFSEEYPPLCRVAASGQVSLFRCSSHLSSEYPSLFILCFFACKTQFPPGRSRLASLSTNIICRIFSGMCYFLRDFFNFFCELFHRSYCSEVCISHCKK